MTLLNKTKRQGNVVAAILNNSKDLVNVLEDARNAEGSAMEENEKYMNSIQGKMAQLETGKERLSTGLLDSSTVKTAVSLITALVNGSASLVENFGSLPTILTTISVILSAMNKNVGMKYALLRQENYKYNSFQGLECLISA